MDRVDVTPTLETYKSLTPIKWFCNKVLPCVYDDTLSDYELICKCIKYLNDMVSNNEGVQENVQKLYDAFVQLQEWVNANVNDEVFAEFVNNYVSNNEEFIESVKTIAEPIVKDVVDEYVESVTEMNVPHLAFMTPTGYVGKPSFRRIVEEDLPSTITDVVAVKTANTFFASPDGSGGTPSFRKMVMSDLPNAVPEHIDSRSNPHGVTAEQVGAIKVNAVVDNLNSTSTTSPLSANQGKVLNESKAPSGYGYGGLSVRIGGSVIFRSESELENALESVFNTLGNGETKLIRFVGYPDNSDYSWFGILSKSSANYGSLFAHSAYNHGKMISKAKIGGAWEPLEWYNPPMVLGVEYRTTDRWWGSPVYKRLISIGSMPNSTEITLDGILSGVNDVVAYSLNYSTDVKSFIHNDYVTEIGQEGGYVWAKIKTNSDLSSYTGYLTLAYCKKEG